MDLATMSAEEAMHFLAAPNSHVVVYRDHQRITRRQQQNRATLSLRYGRRG